MIRKGSHQLAKDLEDLSKAIETLPLPLPLPLLSTGDKNFRSELISSDLLPAPDFFNTLTEDSFVLKILVNELPNSIYIIGNSIYNYEKLGDDFCDLLKNTFTLPLKINGAEVLTSIPKSYYLNKDDSTPEEDQEILLVTTYNVDNSEHRGSILLIQPLTITDMYNLEFPNPQQNVEESNQEAQESKENEEDEFDSLLSGFDSDRSSDES
jgi:hypothetical protein